MKTARGLVFFILLSSQVFGSSWFSKFFNDPSPSYEEEVYLSLRHQGVLDEILVAYYNGTNFYLPLTELFDFFAINYTNDPATFSVSGYYLETDNEYTVDFYRYFASIGDRVVQLDADDFIIKEVDYFVSANLLNEVFNLGIDVDISRLTIRLESPEELPIVKRYARRKKEHLRQLYTQDVDETEYELISGREPRRTEGAFFDYSIYNALSAKNNYLKMNVGAGGEVFAGDVQGTILTSVNQGVGELSLSNFRWRYVDTSRPWYSAVSLGELSSVGLMSQTYHGAQITNEPLVPKRSYDSYVLDGVTDPGAEVELYENDRLVDVIKADDIGYYRFMVPLNYGQSQFKIRIFERQGRVIELDRYVQIPFNFLPVDEVRYTVGTGRLASANGALDGQRDIASGRVSMGLKNWLTGGVGFEYISLNNSDKPVYYGQLSSRMSNDILFGLDAVWSNYYKFTMRKSNATGASYTGDYTYYASDGLYNVRGYRHRLNSSFFYPFKYRSMSFSTRGSLNLTRRVDGSDVGLSLNVTQFTQGIRFQYGLKENHRFEGGTRTASSTLNLGAVYIIPRRPSIKPWLQGTYLRTELTFDRVLGQFKRYSLQYNKQLNSRLKAQSLFSVDLVRGTKFFEVGVVWDVDKFRTSTSIRSVGSTPSFIESVRGSVGWDRNNNQLVFDNRQQVGRSGLTIRMFVDENNSGTYDEGEEILKGNALTVVQNSSRPVTNNGITRLTQLQPYRRYNLQINEARIDNPILTPVNKKFAVVTDPNRYKLIDVPFYTVGIIDGSVDRMFQGKRYPVAGLKLHVKEIDGDFEQTVRTFADGSFYSMDIPPGHYEITVDESQLLFLNAIARPASRTFTLQQDAEGDYIEGLYFVLE